VAADAGDEVFPRCDVEEDDMDHIPAEERFPTDSGQYPVTVPVETVELTDGGEFELRIAPVRAHVGDKTVRMLAYNGSIPGPSLRVPQGAGVSITVVNESDLETTVHWHGLRLDNRYDGTLATQQAIPIGGNFTYQLTFPDPGVYWYHPHIREDYGQELGLYGSIVVVPADIDYWPPAHREVALTLDDILLEEGHVAPFHRHHPTYVAMGRFGNVLLTNGEAQPVLRARSGEVVRFFLTNTANARVFNVGLRGSRMKLVGGDSGRYEHEQFVDGVVLAPSERAVVDVLFEQPGETWLEHRTPGHTYRLATIVTGAERAMPSLTAAFAELRHNAEMTAVRQRLMNHWRREPDKTLALVAQMDMPEPVAVGAGSLQYVCPMHPHVVRAEPGWCPECRMKLVPSTFVHARVDGATPHQDDVGRAPHGHAHGASADHDSSMEGIEWEDDMVELNRMTTPANMRWKLVDRRNGAEGEAIDWAFRVGQHVKIRIVNEMDSDHPMHHPFHIHGAGRFVILSRNGVEEPNLVWKDTVLVRTGQTVDVLLDVTHPGVWMAHCHIAEHHESGMMLRFRVEGERP
jgi:FtsP/CotA-like multicopper oxidase with cupredoxin domain